MNLITCCPACSTLFKVVPDQLRISAGWVRCGHCAEVFDAQAHLQPQGLGAEVPQTIAPVSVPAPEPIPNFASLLRQPDQPDAVAVSPVAWPDEAAEPAGAASADVGAAVPVVVPLVADPAAAEPVTTVDFVLSDLGRNEEDSQFDPGDGLPSAPSAADDAPQETPSFVAQARRRAFWASRPVRLGLGLAVVVLALGLGLQMIVSQRDWLAARHPQLAPALAALCHPLGCAVQPYRRLEAIVIDSSSFNREGPNAFRFSLTLRNSAGLPVATPALELALTDVQDQVMVRRVVHPADLGAPAALAARGEFSGASALTVADASQPSAIVGYRLNAFYP
ncbi:zinc-ribbon and DUF3426 domain-containing protein [Ottowia sp.]|jgi:predicted Zn finger-like uncharacterized protein|uniref:zinc-ribbon and DUF3426 domain-containing protein n=1 Tax=Ottowia sp. TaxID=1898956 RepID=UPI0025CF748D|nr:zinc-ribbon and DUF3426 domain-containing protein [Ottowia sp.]MBK6615445.1 DUF3426 domain-containing protein [Ottowia sp.]MBK6746517.1 DUF3426 domain-containing protein [Ottowia sp.]